MIKGVLHLHSTWSDGDLTIPELRDVFVEAGCRFACITDHADWLDDDRLAAYRAECAAYSDGRFRFVPSLEYSCVDRMHVLGYGVTAPIRSMDPETVIRHIQAAGGLAVVAHPKDTAFPMIESFDALPDGIEVWNSKYDGRYAPRPGTFALLARLRTRRPTMRAYYGQDLHWRRQYRGLYCYVEAEQPEPSAILEALASGAYAGMKDDLVLPSDGVLAPSLLAAFERAQRRTQAMRSVVRRTKRWADGLGVPMPAGVKAQLRRIF
jgi:hypothetical protein